MLLYLFFAASNVLTRLITKANDMELSVSLQVVVGSFIADGRKESKSANQVEPLSATTRPAPTGGSTGASSPPSRGTLSESSGGQGSPLNQSSGACNNSNPQGMSGMPWK